MNTRRILLLALTTTFTLALLGGNAIAEKPPVPIKCSKDKIKGVWAAKHGEFKIQSGMAEETRSGYVERRKLKLSSKCLLEIAPGDRVALIFDEKHKNKLRRSTGYQMQCVDAKKPTGKFLSYDAAPQADSADGKSWTPPCSAKGLNKAEKKACSKGISNSERHSHFREMTKKAKTFTLDFFVKSDVSTYSRSSESLVGSKRESTTAAEVAPSGRVFCQYFSKEDGDILFGFFFNVPKS